ncbi:unnamed protein product, partial [Effrenium voratum]
GPACIGLRRLDLCTGGREAGAAAAGVARARGREPAAGCEGSAAGEPEVPGPRLRGHRSREVQGLGADRRAGPVEPNHGACPAWRGTQLG